MIRRNPCIPIDVLENELRTKYQVEVHMHRLYRAKQAALGSLKEDHARCYVWCAHAWDIEVKCDHATNNLSEAFNSWIGKLRNQHVLTLLENLPRKVIKRMHKRITECIHWSTELPPVVHRTLEKLRQEGRFLMILSLRFLMILARNGLLILDTILVAVVHGNLVVCHLTWPEIPNDKILPPIVKTKPRRPKVKRRREQGEFASSKVVQCTGCRGLGHNIRSCKKKSKGRSKPNKKKVLTVLMLAGRGNAQHI
ncbi:hypothetical protein Dsin_005933 [Dipteronia sinensis]|uniref:Uncharacterized protein n=1 Tax=Dipteronia sinensis TaxID=43782 RepID=A0AAE0EF59_9ROSI|nr:hypothetical protein Dsin_005933 [Dipteronia sinensis]